MHSLSLNGGRLASGCGDGNVHIWEIASGTEEAVLKGHTDWIYVIRSLAALPNGLLASGSTDRSIRVWNVAARTCVAVLQGHTDTIRALATLPDGRLASGSNGDDGVIYVWELHPVGSAGAARAAADAAAVIVSQPRGP